MCVRDIIHKSAQIIANEYFSWRIQSLVQLPDATKLNTLSTHINLATVCMYSGCRIIHILSVLHHTWTSGRAGQEKVTCLNSTEPSNLSGFSPLSEEESMSGFCRQYCIVIVNTVQKMYIWLQMLLHIPCLQSGIQGQQLLQLPLYDQYLWWTVQGRILQQ